MQDVETAVQDISSASGYTFVFTGYTTDLPGPARQEAAVAGSVPPLLIAFHPVPASERGVGGLSWMGPTGGKAWATYGYAEIDPSLEASPGFGPGQFEGPVLLHELGHALGLAHPIAPGQIMWPLIGADTPRSYQAGDRQGLAILHELACGNSQTTLGRT
jgi:hypothetical protein